jgi:hypothetical protein
MALCDDTQAGGWRAALHPGPTAVLMTTDDGEREEVFATRRQAELFLSYIPVMAVVSAEFAAVRSAILSPLVAAGRPLALESQK